MIEKIDINEVERNMPSGTPVMIRGLDGAGKGIISPVENIQNMPHRGSLNNTDISTITIPGTYYLTTGNTNCPYGDYSYLLVISISGYLIQFNIHNGAGGIQYRKRLSGGWRAWTIIVPGG